VVHLALACAAAVGSAALYASAVTLQALEARSAPVELQLRPSLIGFLLTRRRWLLGTALGALGWPLQAVALAFGPLTLVQPILALSVVGLLATGHRVLGEPVGRRSLVAVAAVLAGIALLALEAPTHTAARGGALPALTLAALGALSLVPFARVRGSAESASVLAFAAGTAYVMLALATTLLDSALGRGAWWVAAIWLAVSGAGAAIGGLTEMSAFHLAPATVVAPIIFCFETVAPAFLAPVVGQRLGTDPRSLAIDLTGLSLVGIGVTLLARSGPVAKLVAAGTASG
jgi:drug/metabolite transporter (DMT)-like permease